MLTYLGAVTGAAVVFGMVGLGLAGVFRTPAALPDNSQALEAFSRACQGTLTTHLSPGGVRTADCQERHQPLPELTAAPVEPEKKGPKVHFKAQLGGR